MALLKSVRIYEDLRRRLVSGHFAPGERMVVRHLSQMYDSSDIPVREALRMLQQDGLIEFEAHKGARVRRADPAEVAESYLIRGALEALATSTAVGHLSESDFGELDRLMGEMRKALEAKDSVLYADLNREFHETIFAASPYRRLHQLITKLWDEQSSYQMLFNFTVTPNRPWRSYEEHAEIIACLRAGDEDRAQQLARRHKEAIADELVTALRDAQTFPP